MPLRDAITFANSNAGADVINFSIAGAGVHTIAPLSALPAIVDLVTIDGYSQPGAVVNTNAIDQGTNAVLLIELNLTSAGGGGLVVNADDTTIRGLVINRSPAVGLSLQGRNNVVAGNFIGTILPARRGSQRWRRHRREREQRVIGGLTLDTRNVISGNGAAGIRASGGAVLLHAGGNLIGTNAAGNAAIPNVAQGIVAAGAGAHSIGRSSTTLRNVIAGNGSSGILIASPSNSVAGNYIGMGVSGVSAIGNQSDGITINANQNAIGVPSSLDGNVISANAANGILINGDFNTVENNLIGVDALGSGVVGNGQVGINIAPFSDHNTVGVGNTIAFNAGPGIQIFGAGATGGISNRIDGNSIHSNSGGLGIKLGSALPTVPTPNDAGDADTGPNNLQNFPLDHGRFDRQRLQTISGTLNSNPSSGPFELQFSRMQPAIPRATARGQTFLGIALTGTTDGSGNLRSVPFLPDTGGQTSSPRRLATGRPKTRRNSRSASPWLGRRRRSQSTTSLRPRATPAPRTSCSR